MLAISINEFYEILKLSHLKLIEKNRIALYKVCSHRNGAMLIIMNEKIFISHNSKDKAVVEPIAFRLADVFGKENIFYDSWSIRPGDGIIDKMNAGLGSMTYFLFFISRNSIHSEMVKLEWQNALVKTTKNQCKFIPIKIDDCVVPDILLQNLYIDFNNYGFEVGLSQLINVIQGNEPVLGSSKYFNNVAAELIFNDFTSCIFVIKAIHFQEPIARFLILYGNKNEELNFEVLSDSFYNGGPNEGIKLDNGIECNGFYVGVSRALAPNFSLRVKITHKEGKAISFLGIMKALSEEKFASIPTIPKPFSPIR